MGRFHVGDPAEDDEPALSSPSAAAAAAAATAGSNVEAMEVDDNLAHDPSARVGHDSDEEAEMLGGAREPWEDRCYDDDNEHVTVRHTHNSSTSKRRSEPVSTPPPPHDDSSSNAVVPYDPDQAAAEELAAQMDRDYDRRYRSYSHEHEHQPEYDYHDDSQGVQDEQEEEEEEERERQTRIDTRIRMLWGGRDEWLRRRRGNNDAGDEEYDENEERRVGGHVLGGGGYNMYNSNGGGDAPPYSANIYGHGYGYYQGGQTYNDGGAMMAAYNGNGHPHAFHPHNGNSYQPSLLQRLRHTRPIVRYSLIILSGLILSYLSRRAPPPPPPHYDWASYVVHSTHSILGEVERVSHDTVYILGGFVRNVYQDAVELKDAMAFGGDGDGAGGGRNGRCVLRIPTFPMDAFTDTASSQSDTTSYIERRLGENIFGQERAIRAISRALEAWEGPTGGVSTGGGEVEAGRECTLNSSDDDDENSETCKAPISSPNHRDGGKPLTLLLSGPEGTGKSETARLLAQLAFLDCLGSGNISANDSVSSPGLQSIHQAAMPRGVLFIDGRSYSDVDGQQPEGYAYHQRTRAFSDRIVGHIQKQRGAGAVIVISQIEDVSPSIAGELVRLIRSSSSAKINSNDSSGRLLVGEKGVQWNNVLFLFTSYLGADKLFQLIHTYEGIEYISDKDLTTTVRNEIDNHFGSSTGLGNAINTVATFMPLEAEQMEDVLYRKVRELSQKHEGSLWKRLDVTEQALSYFAGPDHNEYLSLKHRETGSTVFSFSKRGAHTLDDDILLQTLRSARRHIPTRPDEIAVFDYDLNKGVATIRWCTDDESDSSLVDRQHQRSFDLSTYKCAGNVAWKGDLK